MGAHFSRPPIQVCVHNHARIQFCARELPVREHVYADHVCHRVHDYVLYVNIFLVLYCLTLYYIILPYTTLKYVILVNIINNENLNPLSFLTTGKR